MIVNSTRSSDDSPDRGNYQYIEDLIKKSDLKEQFHYLDSLIK